MNAENGRKRDKIYSTCLTNINEMSKHARVSAAAYQALKRGMVKLALDVEQAATQEYMMKKKKKDESGQVPRFVDVNLPTSNGTNKRFCPVYSPPKKGKN